LPLYAVLFISVGCTQMKRRTEVRTQQNQTNSGTSPKDVGFETHPEQDEDGDFQTLPPQISNQRAKKVGLVFGMGGARSFALAGLLRSFEKNKINVSHLAATGWPSLIAASYAMSGEIHGMDWKLYKLEEANLKFDKGFLGFGGSGASSKFHSFLKENFNNLNLDSAKVNFSCATRSLNGNQSVILKSGSAIDALNSCVPVPPFFGEFRRAASPASLFKMAKHLKAQGAEIVVFIDLLDESIQREGLIRKDKNLEFLWSQILESQEAAKMGIKNSYSLNLRRYSIFDFSNRKALEAEGEKQGEQIAQKLIRAYGL